jgi:hypothetical protein
VNVIDVIERALPGNSSDTETGANIETVARHRDHACWQLASLEATPATNDRDWWLEQTAKAGTDWPGILDGCRDLLAIGVGENTEMDTFERACREADRRAGARPRDADLDQLRRLLHDDVTLASASVKLQKDRSTPATAVEALMYSLRRGVNELAQHDTQRRLSELNKHQLEAVCLRVQAFEPTIAQAWSADDADLLISAWRKFSEQR